KILSNIKSEVYFAYNPSWGRLNPQQVTACQQLIDAIDDCLGHEQDLGKSSNLEWLKANYVFTLLLDEVGRCMETAWEVRELVLSEIATQHETIAMQQAVERLQKAPIDRLITTYAARIRSRGELGALSSINQRVWQEYQLLTDFLRTLNMPK